MTEDRSSGVPAVGTFHPPEHWAQLRDAGQDDGAESALGALEDESTNSISSSILNYRTIHGRTYHAEVGAAQYWASNDEANSDSQDINHHALLLILENKLFLAPLKLDSSKVLDIGTGTGQWAIDFADEHPSAEVIGTDISPIQPSWVPPNLRFEIDDCNSDWTFTPDSFDYVHMRYLFGSIPNWTALFKNALKVCKPGGWAESYEPTIVAESDDETVKPESALGEWHKFFVQGAEKSGRSYTIVEEDLQRKGMEEAGFINIQSRDFKVPIGSWPKDPKMKEIGEFLRLSLERDIEGYILYMASQFLGWTKDQVSVYCAQLRREIRSGRHHAFFRQRVVWGQKPEQK